MADALPTWDEALQNGGKSALPTWDEAVEKHGTSALDTTLNAADALLRFPERAMGGRNIQQSVAVDDFFKKTSAGRIMGAFGTGVEHSISQDGRPFGLDEQTEKFLKDSGVFNNYADGQTNLIRSFNEALIKPAAVGVDSAMRALDAGFMGPTGAIAQGAREIGQPALASDIELLPEYLMGGHAAIPHILPPEIAHAKVVGVLDSEAVYMGTKERTPQQVSDAYKAAATLPEDIVAYEAPKPFDIHQTAREIAPETFTKYDALAREKENYRTQLSDMREERVNTPQIQALDEQISAIEEPKKGGYGKKQALIEKRDALLDEAKTDTPEMAEIRRKLQETDYGQRDLAVDVSKAYREAKERSPAEDAVLEEMQEQPTELEVAPESVPDQPSARPIEEQVAAIKQDMVSRIVAAGRPLEEANAVAQLEAARYRTAAEMFEGKRGTAEELYKYESAKIKEGVSKIKVKEKELAQELDQRAKGKIRLAEREAKATITLFKTADASTLIHEKGHEWTDQILRWAKESETTEQLRKDAATIRKYVGVAEDADLTRKQHEKMARGFERYLMEGVAPNRELATVFAKFKKWLTDLYQTVQRLRSPISDDIRDVFDRMFATNPEKTVLAPDSEPGKMIADHHEYDATNTPPERAAEVRTQIRQEADRTAQQHDEELYGELTRPSDGQPAAAAAAAGTISEGEPASASVPTETPDQISQRGTEAVTDGLRLSEQDTKPDTDGKFPDSPNAPFRRPESELVYKAGNIRLDNLNTPEDVNQVLRDIASENQDFMPARRGVISVTEQMDLADALGMDSTKLNMRKIGEAYNAEQIIAARKMLIQSATSLRDLAIKASEGSEADLMAYAQAKARHTMIQDQVSGITAEAGRALAAFRALEGGKEAKLIGELLQKQTGMDLFQLQAEAKMMAEMDTTAKVSKFVKDSQKPTFMDKMLEFRTASMLWGPKTHIKNALGNMITTVNSVVETAVAAGIGKAREVVTGKTGERVYGSEVKARTFGVAQGAKDGAKMFAQALMDENFQFGNSQIEHRRGAIPGVAGEAVRGSFRALNASDAFFKAIAYRQELNAIAYRIAERDGLKGDDFNRKVTDVVQDPSETIMKQAMQNAEYQTYQNQLGPTGRKVQSLVNSNWATRIIFPFVKTPINIIKYAGERTPLGLFSSEVRNNLSGKNGDIARDTQAARIVWGTALAGAAYTMAMEGNITGGGPSDRKERAAWMLAGNQEYSVKVGDGWYSYGWAEPLSTIWGTAASMAELQKNGQMDEENSEKLPLLLLGSINKNIIQKSFLRGGNEAAQMLLDPDRYAEKWGQNFVASFVPNLLSQQASAGDEYQREIHTTLDAIKNKIPGQRETLLPRRDIWGEPMSSGDSLGPDILSPIYEKRLTQDPVNKAIGRLGWAPDKPQRKIMGVELTDQQYDNYARTAGRMAKMRLNPVAGNPGFGNLPQKAQLDIIQKTVSQSRETARKLIMMQNPEIMRQAIENKRKDARGGK